MEPPPPPPEQAMRSRHPLALPCRSSARLPQAEGLPMRHI